MAIRADGAAEHEGVPALVRVAALHQAQLPGDLEGEAPAAGGVGDELGDAAVLDGAGGAAVEPHAGAREVARAEARGPAVAAVDEAAEAPPVVLVVVVLEAVVGRALA